MAVQDYEESADRGQPFELFLFQYGDNSGRVYGYTDAHEAIDYDGVTYEPIAITRDTVKTEGRGESQSMKVEVPMSSDVAMLFRQFPPGRVVSLIVRQSHKPNGDDPAEFLAGEQYSVVWTGQVLESQRSGSVASLNCENAQSGMKKVGLRLHYQWPCPLALYSTRCRANKEDAKTTATATSVANAVTFSAGWNGSNDASAYIGGLVEWDSDNGREYRTILSIVSENVVKLNASMLDFTEGSAVDIFLGCPHNLAGCASLHNNAVNYGGHHLIPLVNPVNKNNHT